MSRNLSPEKIVDLIYQAGVVGAGGGGFPTHIKYRARSKTVIANGAECEPLLNTDKAIMAYQPERIIRGLRYAMLATGASEGIIALKEHFKIAVAAMNDALSGVKNIRLHLLGDFYPAGDEFNLVYETTGRIIPEGGLPLNVGCVVSNVGTLVHVADAIEGKPVVMRSLTVNGEVTRPGVITVPLGTSIADVIKFAGGARMEPTVAFIGGPMMGHPVTDLNEPISKTTGGLILLPQNHPLVKKVSAGTELRRAKACCEACRYCTDFCTRYLLGHRIQPHLMIRALAYKKDLPTEHLTSAFLCCSCGICNIHACPASLNPKALYQSIRREFARQKLQNPLRNQIKAVHPDREGRKLSVTRLAQRTGVIQYQCKLEQRPVAFFPDTVRIKISISQGAQPVIPIVRTNERVKKGQIICRPKTIGSDIFIHASMSGTVTRIDSHYITIDAT